MTNISFMLISVTFQNKIAILPLLSKRMNQKQKNKSVRLKFPSFSLGRLSPYDSFSTPWPKRMAVLSVGLEYSDCISCNGGVLVV